MDKNEINSKIEYINCILSERLPKDSCYGRICEAMRYSVLNGGKRLRAIMLLEAFKIFNPDYPGEAFLAEPFAAAIEFIHAYSLVHDDLPAMDNDVLRRGKPTTHIEFGHAMGVLTGDALLNFAFETISEAALSPEFLQNPSKQPDYSLRLLKAFNIMAAKPGFSGMIGGQVLDTCIDYSADADYSDYFPEADCFIKGTDADANRVKFYLRIYELKTSQLFETALMCGAILGGASQNEIELMEKAGKMLGLAFQIQDDILDITSDPQTLGKSVNIDERNNKTTVARQLGLDASEKLAGYYTQQAVECLKCTGRNVSFLEELFISLVNRKL